MAKYVPLPLFLDLEEVSVLVVGGGAIAVRAAMALADAGARLTVIAPQFEAALVAQALSRGWRLHERAFRAGDVTGQRLVIAASGVAVLDAAVAVTAKAAGIWSTVAERSEPGAVLAATVRPPGPETAAAERVDQRPVGSVALVGAGPGAPELLTLAALHHLRQADVIVHDQLVSDEVLELARPEAERIAVGKRGGGHSVSQMSINTLLVALAQDGSRVVRLKGGDPLTFARGGEELSVLQAHGIPFEIVPGITAAQGCAAYAGIALTHRDHAQGVRLVTAHCQGSLDRQDWTALARGGETLVFYMGVAMAADIEAKLLAGGRDPATPFAAIENGTRPQQRVIDGRLDQLVATLTATRVRPPALLIVGGVADPVLRASWFGAPAVRPAPQSPWLGLTAEITAR